MRGRRIRRTEGEGLRFHNRQHAAQELADKICAEGRQFDHIVGIPRGGVVLAHLIASEQKCQLDIVGAKKVGTPGEPEVAIGAVTPDGETLFNEGLISYLGINKKELEEPARRTRAELVKRLDTLRPRPPVPVQGKWVLVVDDGIATGLTVIAAVRYLKRSGASAVVVAAPVASPRAVQAIREEADDAIFLLTPMDFGAVGQYYEDFSEVDDETVRRLLTADKP